MYTQAWKIHLPLIALFMKRAASGDQLLSLNATDFERAAGGKKTKCMFSGMQITNGVANNMSLNPPPARELAQLLQESPQTSALLRGKRYEFSLTAKYQLTIKDTTEPAPAVTADAPSVEEEA
jgi:hypothetical protein